MAIDVCQQRPPERREEGARRTWTATTAAESQTQRAGRTCPARGVQLWPLHSPHSSACRIAVSERASERARARACSLSHCALDTVVCMHERVGQPELARLKSQSAILLGTKADSIARFGGSAMRQSAEVNSRTLQTRSIGDRKR